MKKVIVLFLGLMLFSFSSFASQVEVNCTISGGGLSATFANAAGGPTLFTCGGTSALDVAGNSFISATLYVQSDFQNCGTILNTCTNEDIKLTFSPLAGFNATPAQYEDVTGGNSSAGYAIDGGTPTSTQGYLALTSTPVANTFANFDSGFTVNVSSSQITGNLVPNSSSAQVEVLYNYASGVPEPVSMILLGSGLLAVSLIGRKKFLRK
jgi:hypothetical protein